MPHASDGPQESPLSVERAFVVHLGPERGPRRRFTGRVEHLSSGETAQFSSLEGLLTFFALARDAWGNGSERGDPTQDRPPPADARSTGDHGARGPAP